MINWSKVKRYGITIAVAVLAMIGLSHLFS